LAARICSSRTWPIHTGDMEGAVPPAHHPARSHAPAQNTDSVFTRAERISLAQGAIDELVARSFPPGTMESLVSSSGAETDPDALYNAFLVVRAAMRKDWVERELGALTWNSAR
jgi:hypothetical protein